MISLILTSTEGNLRKIIQGKRRLEDRIGRPDPKLLEAILERKTRALNIEERRMNIGGGGEKKKRRKGH